MDSVFDKKYSKSKNNFQCLGPCYEPSTYIIHPTTLEHVTNTKYPFCPVNEWDDIDPKTKQKTSRITDKCFNPIKKKNISAHEVEMNIILPKIDFTFCDELSG